MKDKNKLIEEINENIESIDINEPNKKIEENPNPSKNKYKMPNDIEKVSTIRSSSFMTDYSIGSKETSLLNKTLESMPYKDETDLDLDLPYFTSTKYNSANWIIMHTIFYSAFTLALLADIILMIIKINFFYTKLISDLFFFGYNFMSWLHYRRGCIGYSNLNSELKTNIDSSIKAKLLRSEFGWKYFMALIASFILIYSDIYYLTISQVRNPDFWNINFVGLSIVALTQILKLEKILTNNKQYSVTNDLPNCFLEIFLFFGAMFLSISFLIEMCYDYNINSFKLFITILKSLGTFLIVLSDIALVFRYYFSSYDDLNTSDISNITL